MAAVTLTTIAIGAAIGAGVGAVATYAAGGRGDALWKGALVGAVGGAITGGVGSWASAAGYGALAAGGMAGAAGGVAAGALGTALNGGNGSDYLRNIATGGLMGGVLGAAGGGLFGSEAGAAANGEMADTIAQNVGQADYAAGGDNLMPGVDYGNTPTGTGVGQTASTGVQQSITGPTAAPTQGTTTPLADTVSNISSGFGSDTALPTGAKGLDSSSMFSGQTTQPTTTGGYESFNKLPANYAVDDYATQAQIDAGTANPMGTKDLANSYEFKMKDLGADMGLDTFGYGKTLGQTPTTGIGKMGLEDYLKMQGKAQLIGGGIKTLGAFATAPETARNRQQLMDLYNEQNNQNQLYANKLQQTYDNPMGYLGSGEAAATRSAALQKALAMNAAAGRRTQGGALSNLLMQEQLKNLGAYRQGMPRPNYGTAAQTLNFAQQYSPTADIFGGLASAATPLSLYSLFPG